MHEARLSNVSLFVAYSLNALLQFVLFVAYMPRLEMFFSKMFRKKYGVVSALGQNKFSAEQWVVGFIYL